MGASPRVCITSQLSEVCHKCLVVVKLGHLDCVLQSRKGHYLNCMWCLFSHSWQVHLVQLPPQFWLSLYICFLICIYTPCHTLSSGLRISLLGDLAMSPLRSLHTILLFYDLPRYKTNFFFSSSIHRQNLLLCLKWSLIVTTEILTLFTKVQIVH